jgi:uncharacterized protein YndB with AHSA1/START domain
MPVTSQEAEGVTRAESAATHTPGRVSVSFRVDGPAVATWAALTDSSALTRWLGTPTDELRPGASARLRVGDGEFYDLDEIEIGPIGSLAASLRYHWRFMGVSAPSRVTWTIWRSPHGSSVTIVDDDPERTPDEAIALSERWSHVARRLQRFLTTGESPASIRITSTSASRNGD